MVSSKGQERAERDFKGFKGSKALKKTLDVGPKKMHRAEGILCQRQNDAFPILAVVLPNV